MSPMYHYPRNQMTQEKKYLNPIKSLSSQRKLPKPFSNFSSSPTCEPHDLSLCCPPQEFKNQATSSNSFTDQAVSQKTFWWNLWTGLILSLLLLISSSCVPPSACQFHLDKTYANPFFPLPPNSHHLMWKVVQTLYLHFNFLSRQYLSSLLQASVY